jgi:aryl-alcohol dehydrogenase-like predicted oxidoreductase
MTWGEQNNEQEAHAQLSYACEERGVNLVDSAEMYPVPTRAQTQGRTDQFIGSWLAASPSRRDRIVLATKVTGASERITWIRKSGKGTRVDRANILESVDASLKRLKTDHIDLLQIHWPDRYVSLWGAGAYDYEQERAAVSFREQLEALRDVVAAGKVRHVGVSNETSWGVNAFLAEHARDASLPRIQTIQNSYSLLNRGPFETDLAETCAPRNGNVSLLAYSPLAGGALSGKYASGDAPAGSRFKLFEGYMARFNRSLSREAVQQYVDVAAKHGMTPTELALAFCRSRPFVCSTIIGATSLAQLKSNIDVFESGELLDKAVLADVAAVYKRFRDPATD